MSGDVVARAKAALAYEDGYPVNTCGIHTGRASNRCLLQADHDGQHDDDPAPFTFPDELAVELVAEVEKLRGALETIRGAAQLAAIGVAQGHSESRQRALLDILAVIERAGIEP